LIATYDDLETANIPGRQAAALTGVSRATAARRHRPPAPPATDSGPAAAPGNKLSDAERAHVLAVLNSPRFVDMAPMQIYAQLLDEGVYLCSVSTMYRVLRQSWSRPGPGRSTRGTSPSCPALSGASTSTAT
jgi:hypothetical protein